MKTRGLLIFLGILLFPLASAEILMTQPDSLYNLGDTLKTTITLQPAIAVNDFLRVELQCPSKTVELYRNPVTLGPGGNKVIEISPSITTDIVQDAIGSCRLQSFYGPDTAATQNFDITKEISIITSSDASIYGPNDHVKITGTAKKANGQDLTGFIELQLDDTNVSVSRPVTGGSFSVNFTLPSNAAPGTHTIKLRAYERDSAGRVTNDYSDSKEIRVKTVITRLDVSAPSSTGPGIPVSYSVTVYDQAGNSIQQDVTVAVSDSKDKVVFQKVVKSGGSLVYDLPSTALAGYWKIDANVQGIDRKQLFYVEEYENVSYSIVNDTLVVVNIGNVPYSKPVEIHIGNSTYIQDVSLDVGQTKKFRLVAPTAIYSVSVNDGQDRLTANNVPLTGRAISVDELSSGFNGNYLYIIAILVGLLGATLFINVVVQKKKINIFKRKKSVSAPGAQVQPSKDAAFLGGVREDASVVAVKAGNLNVDALETFKGILSQHEAGHKYSSGDYHFIVVSPSIIKNQDHEFAAVQIAHEIESSLKEHNKKSALKIPFGIGIQRGQIISENKGGVRVVTPVGSIITSVKRISGRAVEESLLSKEIHTRVAGRIKEERAHDTLWRLKGISQRDKHNEFISRFMKRNKE